MSLYPVILNIADRLCLVVGGGEVALRKTKSLLACGATVRVISPALQSELRNFAENKEVEWFERGFAEGDLKGVFLVFAATNDLEVQNQIAREATKHSVLMNRADDPQHSHFHVPAHFRRGDMLITVSTGGGSPALAQKIRQELESGIVPEYELVVELLAMIREKVVGAGASSLNGDLFRNLLRQGVVELILTANWFDLQMLLLKELPESVDAVDLMKKFLSQHDKSES